jgi:cytochrome c oxidase assembly protein subunit 15
MFVMGGLQGLLGWYMVKSGLIDNPHVSQYRLTAHLLLAILIYGYMLWIALNLLFPDREPHPQQRARKPGLVLLGLSILTMTSGGFVAGLKAGLAYNTFPLMAGQWIPTGLWQMQPWYRNLFENITTVQFDHRLLATLTFLSIVLFWLTIRRRELTRSAALGCHALLLVALLQVILGISTLLLQVPIMLASAHQAGALILFSAAVFVAHRLHYPERQVHAIRDVAGQTA